MVADSNLAVRQRDGTFALKEISLAPSQFLVLKLSYSIDVELTHVNRSTNRDGLWPLRLQRSSSKKNLIH